MAQSLDIRAREITTLREKNRLLQRQLTDARNIAADNDAIVTMMHDVSLLLIRRDTEWLQKTETLIRRGMKAGSCRIMIFNNDMKALATKTARLPAGGRADKLPLDNSAAKTEGYYHLPLKRGRKAVGLVILTTLSGKKFSAGDDTFCRRLAQLLAAVI
ncbi:hypothetical protein NQX30_04995 [Candidatus Persebacteraceae bacterium Df01]|uniref:GAF domain-containing protein n=1 Tax=Candidatus Doriopsillibacter californiensis TaxID=2970740 RepID=A0ABT7QMG5_9GAMM|nr:hypothetical protein [Candidatus Persebacteraceae bacterium Df01]